MSIIDMSVKISCGLSLFILGMTMMSNGLKMSAGKRIKRILRLVSSNRIIGCITGAGVTALIQSSSATTIIIIGFVSAGLISLQQAIGMILGANVGTTMTAQLIAFKLSNIAMPAIVVGVIMKLFNKNVQIEYIGEVVLGFGLIFFGMTIMKNGLSPMRENDIFLNFFTKFSPDTTCGLLLSVLVGAAVTVAIQSSSATIGLTMAMANQGLITFPSAMALVLGENIGTTITAELATIGSKNINATRTARAHTMFNIIGVSIILIIFPFFVEMVETLTIFIGGEPIQSESNKNISRYIANGHTLFNLLNAIFFLFTLKWLAKVAILISPKSDKDKHLFKLPNFSEKVMEVPAALISEIKIEILKMAKSARITFIKTIKQIEHRNYKKLSRWKQAEVHLDSTQKIILSCLVHLYQEKVSESESKGISNLMRVTNNIERIGDSVESIAKSVEKLIDEKMRLSNEAMKDLNSLAIAVLSFINLVILGIKSENLQNLKKFVRKANIIEETIDNMREEMRQKHINRIRTKICGFDQGLIYINLITNLEKIGDFCFNIAHAINYRR